MTDSARDDALDDRCRRPLRHPRQHNDTANARPTAPSDETTPEPFTDAWFEQRGKHYDEDALRLVAALAHYEDVHPNGALCLATALTEAQASIERQKVRRSWQRVVAARFGAGRG